jgi:hypothetical protein
MQTQTEHLFIKTDEVAQLCRCCPKTILRWNKAGLMPRPIGDFGPLVFDRSEIVEWNKQGRPSRKEWESRKKMFSSKR